MVLDGIEDIIREFVLESNEGLDLLERDLVALESTPDSAELMAEIFRAVHTIKGTSGVLGFCRLESIAHAGENLLSQLRDRKRTLNPHLTTVLLAMSDSLRSLLRDIEQHGAEGDKDCDLIVERLQEEVQQPPAQERAAEQKFSEHCCRAVDDSDREIPPANASELPQLREELESAAPRSAFFQPQAAEITQVRRDTGNHGGEKNESEAPRFAASYVRVDVSLLDKLMNLVGELVLARNQVAQCSSDRSDAAFSGATQRLNFITRELQQSVMKTRMQPIGSVWNRFPKLVRDLALQFGKQAVITMEGSDTEVDRTILEAIKDPLTHILRNAIDHGIEPPEQRVLAGKSAAGRVELRAFHAGGHVNLEIRDDGAGIDPRIVRERACQRGLITHEHAARLNDRELLELVFRPGFSTAEKVTNVSGRGVGMDVVKTNIERIGGTVDLYSAPGQGTTLKIRIPLTVTIVPALILNSAGQRFAIPRVNLLELVHLDRAEQIEHVGDVPVYRLRGKLLPLVFLVEALQLPSEPAADAGSARAAKEGAAFARSQHVSRGMFSIVVLQAKERQFGLVVDRIDDVEEIVVKPLSKKLRALGCFAGATILGDGEVVLILDVPGVAQRAGLLGAVPDSSRHSCEGQAEAGHPKQNWLLFQSTKGKRLAVSLADVHRLEEFPATQVELSGEGEVVQYCGQILPLFRISQLLNETTQAGPTLQVVVFLRDEQYFGLVVDRINDITDEVTEIRTQRQRGICCGSVVMQQNVVDLVDVDRVVALANHSQPELAGAGRA